MKVKDMTRGVALERIVLGNSKKLFLQANNKNSYLRNDTFSTSESSLIQVQSNSGVSNWKRAAEKIGTAKNNYRNPEDAPPEFKNKGCCQKAMCWWEPKLPSLTAEFCLESSMHGLKFLAQPKRHLTERIFWALIFIVGLSAAVVLINSVWDRYYQNPVIVSFNPLETDIDRVAFPAVTLCNINKFPISLYKDILKIAYNSTPGTPEKVIEKAKEELQYINSACTLQDSFAKSIGFANLRGDINDDSMGNETLSKDGAGDALLEFLLTKTIPCNQFIRHCLWAEDPVPCGDVFKPIVTDYGKCCTFNMYPIPLLLKIPRRKVNRSRSAPLWSAEEIREWSKWNYDDGILIDKSLRLKYPYRQKRAGMPYGLSFLIDPRTQEYFCPASDSNGVRFMLHSQLEIPHISDFGSAIGMGNEVFVEMQPEITLANKEIRDFDPKTRNCLYGKEKSLEFYNAYSANSCLDECEAVILSDQCNCTYYYMPRREETDICNTDPDSAHRVCILKTKADILDTLEKKCGHCYVLCEDVAYNFETTTSTLQNPDNVWGDHAEKNKPDWLYNELSLVHIYFGSDSTVPKIRSKLYGITDLIANTGGLLGLCLGFSVLSLVEVIYFVTLRLFWQKLRIKFTGKRIANNLMKKFRTSATPQKTLPFATQKKNVVSDDNPPKIRETESHQVRTRVMQLDKQLLPLYPAYANGASDHTHVTQPRRNFGYNNNYANNSNNSSWYEYNAYN